MIYFLIIFLCILSAAITSKTQVNNKVYQYALLAFIVFFISSGYMCGTDWRNYEKLYYELGKIPFTSSVMFIEPFYVLINQIFNKIGLNFWSFFIIIKIVISIILFSALKRYCPPELFYLALLFFLTFFGFFMLVDNPMRNVIAVSITTLALPYLYKKETLKYFLVVLIAVLFHYSAIFMIVPYFISKYNISNKLWISIYLAVNIIFVNPDILFQVATYLTSPFPILGWKIEAYISQMDTVASGKVFSLGLLIHFIFFILILLSRKRIESIPYGKYIFNFAVMFPIVFRMGLTALVFSRFQLYLAIFYSIAVCYVIYSFSFRSRIIYKIGIIIISTYSGYNILTSDYRYIPYTNYFYEKIFNIDRTYEERSNFNKINSPYKDKSLFEQ